MNFEYSSDIATFSKLLSFPIIFFVFFIHFANSLYNSEKKFETFITILIIFLILNCVFGFFFLFTGVRQNPAYLTFLTGFFSHPNTSAFAFTLITPLLLYKFFTNKIKFPLFITTLGFIMIALLFTFSRSGYLGVFVGILFYTYIKSKKIFFIALSVILLMTLLFFLDASIQKTDSTLARLLLILTSIQMIMASSESFMWGYGVVRALDIFVIDKIFLGSLELVVDPHNLILLLGIQFGMLFTISLVLTFLILIYKSLRIRNSVKSETEKEKINMSLAVCIAVFFHNMLEDIVVYPEFFVMPIFFIFAGLLYKYSLRYDQI